MARPSKIDRLPDEIKSLIGELRKRGRTIDEILAKLRELDIEVSRSGLGRHIQGLDEIAAILQRQHDISTALIERFGDEPESKVARMNYQLMHAQLTRLSMPNPDGTVTLDPQGAYFLSTALARLGQAAKFDADREIKLRERIEKEEREKAARTAGAAAKKAGISDGVRKQIEEEILGLVR